MFFTEISIVQYAYICSTEIITICQKKPKNMNLYKILNTYVITKSVND